MSVESATNAFMRFLVVRLVQVNAPPVGDCSVLGCSHVAPPGGLFVAQHDSGETTFVKLGRFRIRTETVRATD